MSLSNASLTPASALTGNSNEDPWVIYQGGEGPGQGKNIVLVAGDEEYRSEEVLPMLGKVLATHHGFRCTVLFSTDREDGTIDPNEQTHIPGLENIAAADMLVLFLRFRELPDDDMKRIVDHLEAGKRSSAFAPRPTPSTTAATRGARTRSTACAPPSGRADSASRSWARPGSLTTVTTAARRRAGSSTVRSPITRSCAA